MLGHKSIFIHFSNTGHTSAVQNNVRTINTKMQAIASLPFFCHLRYNNCTYLACNLWKPRLVTLMTSSSACCASQETPEYHHCPLLATPVRIPAFQTSSCLDTHKKKCTRHAAAKLAWINMFCDVVKQRLRKSQLTDFTTTVGLYQGHSAITVSVVKSEVTQSQWKEETWTIKTPTKRTGPIQKVVSWNCHVRAGQTQQIRIQSF